MPKTVDYEREMGRIVALLYFDPHLGGYRDKEWGPDTLKKVAEIVQGTFEISGTGANGLSRIRRFPHQKQTGGGCGKCEKNK